MHIASRFRRGFAAALAAVSLLSAAARPMVACEMGSGVLDEPASASSSGPAQAASVGHAHHAPSEAPEAPATPNDLGCDHLVGCAAIAMTTAPTVASAASTMVDAAPRWVAARPDAPVRALEPPPPRA